MGNSYPILAREIELQSVSASEKVSVEIGGKPYKIGDYFPLEHNKADGKPCLRSDGRPSNLVIREFNITRGVANVDAYCESSCGMGNPGVTNPLIIGRVVAKL
ncbi:hypothetical protein HY029_05545 [Candidatus Gottesmanbacteria bacterium]|nr:hypothetical protein [Candidatus Gottesmanbacteria bacterium]